MITVNKLLLIIFSIIIISCNNKTNSIPEVDFDADKLIYKLEILDNDSDTTLYKTDNHNKCDVMISKKIYVLDKCFQGGIKNMTEVLEYCKKHKKEINSPYDVKLRTTISIKIINNKYKDVWEWDDDISLYFDHKSGNERINTYGIREGKIKVATGWVKEKEGIRICLKIIFDEPDLAGGYKQNILNFARTENTWMLLKRERINTMKNDINKEKIGCCYDTINRNCEIKFNDSKVIFITDEMMFDLMDTKCY